MAEQGAPAAEPPMLKPIKRLAVFLLLVHGYVLAQPAADFYANRTVTILVGSGAGGATDISARVIGQYLGRHIPGNPTVVVVNMPGGGSVTMTNHVTKFKIDDTKLLIFILNSYLQIEKVESRPEIQTKMAGRVKSPGWISHVRESHVRARAQRLFTHVKSKRHVRVFV